MVRGDTQFHEAFRAVGFQFQSHHAVSKTVHSPVRVGADRRTGDRARKQGSWENHQHPSQGQKALSSSPTGSLELTIHHGVAGRGRAAGREEHSPTLGINRSSPGGIGVNGNYSTDLF